MKQTGSKYVWKYEWERMGNCENDWDIAVETNGVRTNKTKKIKYVRKCFKSSRSYMWTLKYKCHSIIIIDTFETIAIVEY